MLYYAIFLIFLIGIHAQTQNNFATSRLDVPPPPFGRWGSRVTRTANMSMKHDVAGIDRAPVKPVLIGGGKNFGQG
uniref:Uncharacterized protein n=1 Tax=Panagrellus redivivus TaxID=6233 RepID=A0A7E4V3E9_PANRE